MQDMRVIVHYVFVFVALTLVTFRLDWFAIEDDITKGIRGRLVGWAKRRQLPRLAAFWECPWCVGFWIGVLVVVLAVHAPGAQWVGHREWAVSLPRPVLWPLAINMVVAPAHLWLDRRFPNRPKQG